MGLLMESIEPIDCVYYESDNPEPEWDTPDKLWAHIEWLDRRWEYFRRRAGLI